MIADIKNIITHIQDMDMVVAEQALGKLEAMYDMEFEEEVLEESAE